MRGEFRIRNFVNRGGSKSYRVTGTQVLTGKRIRRNFTTYREASVLAAALHAEANGNRIELYTARETRLTETQLREAERVFDRLAGLSGQVPSLSEAVEGFLAGRGAKILQLRTGVSNQQALGEYLSFKHRARHRERTIKAAENYLRNFFSAVDKPLAEITKPDVEGWVFRRDLAPKSIENRRIVLGAFFTWAIGEHLAGENYARALKAPKIDQKCPEVLKPSRCRQVMEHAVEFSIAPAIALRLFAGLRRSETDGLLPSDVDLQSGTVTIRGEVSKTRQRRVVDLPPNCVEWLRKYWDNKSGFVIKDFRHRAFTGSFGEGKWIDNGLRHTAATVAYVLLGAERASVQLGHSVGMLHHHYRGLLSTAEAEEIRAIRPE